MVAGWLASFLEHRMLSSCRAIHCGVTDFSCTCIFFPKTIVVSADMPPPRSLRGYSN